MRELIGYFVASRSTEQAAARMAVGIHQRFRCEHFLCKEDVACSADCRFSRMAMGSTRIPTESRSTDSAQTDTPITIIYAAKGSSHDAIEAITSAIPPLASSIEALGQRQAAGPGARRK